MAEFGNPQRPCSDIQKSRTLLDLIADSARENVSRGQGDAGEVELGLQELREDVARNLGMACAEVCGGQERCMMETFGPKDLLFKKDRLTPVETKELAAKKQFDELRALAEMSQGVFLG